MEGSLFNMAVGLFFWIYAVGYVCYVNSAVSHVLSDTFWIDHGSSVVKDSDRILSGTKIVVYSVIHYGLLGVLLWTVHNIALTMKGADQTLVALIATGFYLVGFIGFITLQSVMNIHILSDDLKARIVKQTFSTIIIVGYFIGCCFLWCLLYLKIPQWFETLST